MRADPAISLMRLGSTYAAEPPRRPPDNNVQHHAWEHHNIAFSQDESLVVQTYSTGLLLAFLLTLMFLRRFSWNFGCFNNLAQMTQLGMETWPVFSSVVGFNFHGLVSHILDRVPGSSGFYSCLNYTKNKLF